MSVQPSRSSRRQRSECSDAPVSLSAPARRSIRGRLLAWYDLHKRDLPWRRRADDGYAQLVAEFMLQQTQVSVVRDYYERFIRRFPTISVLAAADQQEVLALWSGLGYYSRARNLHAAAQQVDREHGGNVPDQVEALMKLPGVGRYTAGAIASIAFDRRVPIVDGNVARVLSRVLLLEDDPSSADTRKLLWDVAGQLVPVKRCGDFNQALMELGATVCSPRTPQCLLCPLRGECRALRAGRAGEVPRTRKRARVLAASVVVAAVEHAGSMLFVQRPARGLWGGLWELPSEEVASSEPLERALGRLARRLPAGTQLADRPLAPVTRQLTHRLITFHPFTGRFADSERGSRAEPFGRWLRPDELDGLGVSRAAEAVLTRVGWRVR